MANLAIIKLSGSQHLVYPGDTLKVNKLNIDEGTEFQPEIILSTDNGNVSLNSGNVVAQVIKHTKDKKMHVIKFRAKSRYRRKKGHRQHVSIVKILSINNQTSENNQQNESKN